MRHFKYLALFAVLVFPAVYSHAQVAIGVQIGPDYGLYNAPPVCEYGYYPYYPFDCAPYGYYGPEWFVDGFFIGAGPWYHFYYLHPEFYRRGYWGGPRYGYRGGWDHFRGGGRWFRGDRGFHGEGGFHGSDHGFRGNRGFGGGRGFVGGGGGIARGDHGFGGGRTFSGGDHGFGGGRGFGGGNHGGRGFGGGGGFHGGGGGGSHGGGGGRGGRR